MKKSDHITFTTKKKFFALLYDVALEIVLIVYTVSHTQEPLMSIERKAENDKGKGNYA